MEKRAAQAVFALTAVTLALLLFLAWSNKGDIKITGFQTLEPQESFGGQATDSACIAAGLNPGCVSIFARNLQRGLASDVEVITRDGVSVTQQYTLPDDGHLQQWGIDCTNVAEAGTIILSHDGTLLKADISMAEGGGVCRFGDLAPIILTENSNIIIEGGKITVAYAEPECGLFCRSLAFMGFELEPAITPPIGTDVFPKVPVSVGSKIPITTFVSGKNKIVVAQIFDSEKNFVEDVVLKESLGRGMYQGILDTSNFGDGDYKVNIKIYG